MKNKSCESKRMRANFAAYSLSPFSWIEHQFENHFKSLHLLIRVWLFHQTSSREQYVWVVTIRDSDNYLLATIWSTWGLVIVAQIPASQRRMSLSFQDHEWKSHDRVLFVRMSRSLLAQLRLAAIVPVVLPSPDPSVLAARPVSGKRKGELISCLVREELMPLRWF